MTRHADEPEDGSWGTTVDWEVTGTLTLTTEQQSGGEAKSSATTVIEEDSSLATDEFRAV
jgi:hypothetical protein